MTEHEPDEGTESDFLDFEALGALLDEAASRNDTPERVAFREFFSALGARHFVADEFCVLGPSNHGTGACGGKNEMPPRAIWNNVTSLVAAMDAIRAEIGAPVRITNCYRAPAYNACVGGVSASQHLRFRAADLVCRSGRTGDWADAAKVVRSRGVFSGGIGIYRSFVHVDVRGHPVTWDNR